MNKDQINEQLNLTRSATEKELERIEFEVNSKLKENEDIVIEKILDDLNLEDVGYQEAEQSIIQSSDAEIVTEDSSIFSTKTSNPNITSYGLLNIGSVSFVSPSHNTTYLKARLRINVLGIGKLDLVYGSILPYTKVSNGAWIQNGSIKYFQKTNVAIGSTTLASHEEKHNNIGAKLVAVTAITDRGSTQILPNATITYIVKK